MSFSRFVFLALPVLLAPIIYGSFYGSNSVFEAYAVPPDKGWWDSESCGQSTRNGWATFSCCWQEEDLYNPGAKVTICQTCSLTPGEVTCNPPYVGGATGLLGGAVGPVGPNIFPFDLRDILNLPENATYSIGVEHGPNSDTIRIEIPKALSSSILNQTAKGFELPKALSSSILNQSNVNQTATGLDPRSYSAP